MNAMVAGAPTEVNICMKTLVELIRNQAWQSIVIWW